LIIASDANNVDLTSYQFDCTMFVTVQRTC